MAGCIRIKTCKRCGKQTDGHYDPLLCMGNGIVIDTVVCGDSMQHEWRCLHTATLKMWQWRSQDTEVAWAQELHAAGQHIEAHSADLSSCSAKK